MLTRTIGFELSGWTVLRFWEHEPPTEAAEVVARAVAVSRLRRSASSPGSNKKN